MDLLRTPIGRSHARTLARQVRAASPEAARVVLAQALPEEVRPLLDTEQLEAIRQRLLALAPQHGMALGRTDFYAAIAIFWMVVLATVPVVLPIVWMDDATMALHTSRGITLVMLFLCGTAFARYAGHPHDAHWLGHGRAGDAAQPGRDGARRLSLLGNAAQPSATAVRSNESAGPQAPREGLRNARALKPPLWPPRVAPSRRPGARGTRRYRAGRR